MGNIWFLKILIKQYIQMLKTYIEQEEKISYLKTYTNIFSIKNL